MDVLRQDVIPVASAYLVFLAILVVYRRSRRAGWGPVRIPDAHPIPAWRDLVRYLAGMAVGGFLFFVLIVVVFYFILGNEDRSLIYQALAEGSLLAFVIVVPAFLLITWMAGRSSGRGHRTVLRGGPRDR
jgi:hypothetical protein